MSRRKNNFIARFNCLITFLKKKYRSSHVTCRSHHRRCSVKKSFLKNFASFTKKPTVLESFLIKLQAFSLQVFFKRIPTQMLSVKFVKLLRTPILKNICERLLLEVFHKKLLLKTWQCSQEESG